MVHIFLILERHITKPPGRQGRAISRVRAEGLEPSRISPPDPKSGLSTIPTRPQKGCKDNHKKSFRQFRTLGPGSLRLHGLRSVQLLLFGLGQFLRLIGGITLSRLL